MKRALDDEADGAADMVAEQGLPCRRAALHPCIPVVGHSRRQLHGTSFLPPFLRHAICGTYTASICTNQRRHTDAAPPIPPPLAAAPAESHVIRMWMQNNHCGTIIGKGGVNIKAIREQSDCKVQVSELAPGAAERLVTTTGSIAGINKAAELMIEVLEEQAAADPAAATEGERTHTLKLILSNNQVGGIIG